MEKLKKLKQAQESAKTCEAGKKPEGAETKLKILGSVSGAHFLNDATQSLLIPSYPLLMQQFALSFTELGLLTAAYQLTASILQPFVGFLTDKKPMPRSLLLAMCLVLIGLLIISAAPQYIWLIAGAIVLGMGSSIFHPEASRVARKASGGRFGMAQSIFQVGGNAGSACGPLLVAAIVMPRGQYSLSWLAALPITAIILLLWLGRQGQGKWLGEPNVRTAPKTSPSRPRGMVLRVLAILVTLVFAKFFYTASITNYFIFYLTYRFGISVQAAQVRLFFFMFALAAGTLLGGPLGDRIGRRYVIWFSILGAAPLTLILPYLDLKWTTIVIFIAGLILSSAFSAIVVFGQDLLPGRVGTVAGLFFGLSFGMAGIGAAVLGIVADAYGIEMVYKICSFLPLLGILAVFLPPDSELHRMQNAPN